MKDNFVILFINLKNLDSALYSPKMLTTGSVLKTSDPKDPKALKFMNNYNQFFNTKNFLNMPFNSKSMMNLLQKNNLQQDFFIQKIFEAAVTALMETTSMQNLDTNKESQKSNLDENKKKENSNDSSNSDNVNQIEVTITPSTSGSQINQDNQISTQFRAFKFSISPEQEQSKSSEQTDSQISSELSDSATSFEKSFTPFTPQLLYSENFNSSNKKNNEKRDTTSGNNYNKLNINENDSSSRESSLSSAKCYSYRFASSTCQSSRSGSSIEDIGNNLQTPTLSSNKLLQDQTQKLELKNLTQFVENTNVIFTQHFNQLNGKMYLLFFPFSFSCL